MSAVPKAPSQRRAIQGLSLPIQTKLNLTRLFITSQDYQT
jgi:hypothetical protein